MRNVCYCTLPITDSDGSCSNCYACEVSNVVRLPFQPNPMALHFLGLVALALALTVSVQLVFGRSR